MAEITIRGGYTLTKDNVCFWIHPAISMRNTDGLVDYKFMCFHGEPRIVLVCTDRFSGEGLCEDFFDMDWTHLPMKRPEIPNSEYTIEEPKSLDAMVSMAKTLAKDIPFVRVDFYEVCGKIYFGEITFYPQSGFTGFAPEKYDMEFGSWLTLPGE